ncbi:MAG: segregation and condensation protein A [Chthonomonadales bacterium]
MALPVHPLCFHLPAFDGPLDLLLHLIRKNQIDITDIPIAEITRQYLEYLDAWQSLDLAVAGEYLVMAATLLEIKSRMLLPQPPGVPADAADEDPRAELVQRLVVYERLQQAVDALREWEQWRSRIFFRGAMEDPEGYALPPAQGANATVLAAALQRILARAGVAAQPVTAVAPRRKINLRLKMAEILQRVRASGGELPFHALADRPWDRLDLVMAFLAMLELVRQARLRAIQAHPQDPIVLVSVEEKA